MFGEPQRQHFNAEIVQKLNLAFHGGSRYDKGYRDALESLALALSGTVAPGLLMDALEEAMDAYSNNAA